MRKIYSILLGVAAGSLLFASCTRETIKPGPGDSEKYFPLQVGKYILYDVDSVIYDDFNQVTNHIPYQLRYDVVDSFRDNQGRLSYTINVIKRKNSSEPYSVADVIHVTRTNTSLEWVQKNARLIKMVYPIAEGKSWNSNAYITNLDDTLKEYHNYNWNSHYVNVDKPFNPGNNPFEHTVTVNGIDETINVPDTNVFAARNYSQEIYAYNVGLVYRERIFWEYQPNVGYRKGYEVLMRAVEQN